VQQTLKHKIKEQETVLRNTCVVSHRIQDAHNEEDEGKIHESSIKKGQIKEAQERL
jgi:hypothetical protein